VQFKVYNSILRRSVIKKASEFAASFVPPNVSQQEGSLIAQPPPSTCSGSFAALQSVYSNAQRLKFEIFDKFDRNGDLCIDRNELNQFVFKLLKSNMLDDT
jgi:hypothetical protein